MSPSTLSTSPRLRLLLAISVCAVAGFTAAVASIDRIGLLPPSIQPRTVDIAAAGARVVVDNPRSLLADRLATDGDYETLQKRAVLLSSLMASPPVLAHIARRAGIAPSRLVGNARVTANVQTGLTEPDSERRAMEIGEANIPYHLEIHPDPILPTLSVFARAPTVPEAERLADAAAPGLRDYLRALARRAGTDPAEQVVLEQPGRARGAIVNGGSKLLIFGLTFVFVFGLTALALRLGARLRRRRAPRVAGVAAVPAPPPRPPGVQRMAIAPSRRSRSAGDWPRTTRVLPWMIAAMLAVIWLVPFNVIQLSYSLPIDLKFDRLVLPFIIGIWLLTMAAGGPGAPRVRITGIHVALGAVALAALLSLVIEARNLNNTLELDTSLKKLTLLASYISLFVVMASSIRRSELPAFMSYTLALAVICAIGTVIEHRFAYNVFYSLSDSVLPSVFQVGAAESGAVDNIGRRVVRGPGEVPLEAVAMLAMGLPLAISGLLASKVTRRRIVYGVATALILAAAVSTERKSALLAPASVFLTLAYFRRRELIRLAPLGLVLALFMLLLTPGAAQSVAAQFSGSKFNDVATVSDRRSDYDAVRPDVWSHLAFGRGYGSYEHTSYRILDMELLRMLIEVGVVGLCAFLVLIGTIVAVARRPIRERRPHDAAVALSAAAAAVALLTVSTLFDVMAFPHCPYIALSIAAFLAVVVADRKADDGVLAWSC